MLRAFEPSPSNTLQASNLRFVTKLIVFIDTKPRTISRHEVERVGFCMTSEDKRWDMALDTEGLDWDDEEDVTARYMEALEVG